ncbi:MAG TPA: CRTAC1 family protein [Acidobacteriaceae bacterium]|nr:CRTAC1 family protein [Acidobacteriaceae bacterium]
MGTQQGGTSTAGVFAPVHDAEDRPITSGGIVSKGTIVFKDVTAESGLGSWRYSNGTPEKKYIVESLGGGVALLDYNNDGWLDIYLVNGLTYDAMNGKAEPSHAALFRNNHDGTFTNVAEAAGVTNDRWGVGVAVGDFDNDGWPDLYVTNISGGNRLYRNNHDGTFTDVAAKAGVTLGGWSTGATFGDYDGDGFLDLFVPGYVSYDFKHPPDAGSDQVASNNCKFRGAAVFCGPRGLRGEHDHLFHNNGNGTFTDVSEKAGVADTPGYYGLTSVFVDLDGDGRPDLLVANDSTPNYLYHNKGDGTFEDLSFESGYALNGEGRPTATMGIAVGDYLNNGKLDIADSDFSDDYDVLYRNDGPLSYTDVSYSSGIASPTIPFLGWGDAFIDFDNDGWKDLFLANGHVYPEVDKHDWGTSFAQRPLLFRNLRNGKFSLMPAVKGGGLALALKARGAAFGDLFNDGRIDVVINNLDGPPTLLRDVDPGHNHWVEFRLVGGKGEPRDATGASAFLTAGGITQRGDVLSGGSFASSNDPRVHFGLGQATRIDKLELSWPGGRKEKVEIPAPDCIYTIEQGRGIVGRMCWRDGAVR